MLKTAESVSIGHPDKTADYISSYLLDRLIEQDPGVKYAVEVMIKGNTVILGGEVTSRLPPPDPTEDIKQALRQIGYDERYNAIWGDYALDINHLQIINFIGHQSTDINQGVMADGWGDQGVFVGYACQGDDHINRELFLSRHLNQALYRLARSSDNLGLDIKTQITLDETGQIDTAIVAIPMLKAQDLTPFIKQTLPTAPKHIIINGTGTYRYHSSVADCGITGRKLACDFYSTACSIGGGSPWTKDPTKADLTLNLYARQLALKHLGDNDECFVYLSSCIGKSTFPSATCITLKNGIRTEHHLDNIPSPSELIHSLGLNRPIYADLCMNGLFSLLS